MNTINEVLRAPKHAYRQAESRHGKAQRHRHERRRVKEYMKLQDWQELDES